MAVFAVAAGVLLFTTPVDADAQDAADDPSLSSIEDDIDNIQGLYTPPPTPTPTPEPEPVLQNPISSVRVLFSGSPVGESFTLAVNEELPLNLNIEPVGFDRGDDFNIDFISTNPDVVEVTEVITGQTGLYGFRVSRIGPGNARVRIVITNNGEEREMWTRPVHVR